MDLKGELKDPVALTTADKAFLNSRGYLLVSLDDPLGVGLDTTSIVDSAPEIALSGDAVGNARIAGVGQAVQIDGETFYKYQFTGDLETG